MIRLVNISKFYHEGNVVTLGLRKVNLEFNDGEFVAITGESGSGKSTLLNVISGIDTYEDGELFIDGEETSYFDDKDWEDYRRDYIGFIFQNYNLIDSYTVLENVESAMIVQGIPKKERVERAKRLIERVGLTAHLKHRAKKLSGGEKQRLCIARSLAKNTRIIVADEPTGNLDSETGRQIMELLHEISKDKLVLMVTHNYEEAGEYVTRKIRMFDGEVVEDREVRPFTPVPETYEHPHTVTGSSFKKSFSFGFFNLKNQPRRTLLLMLVTLATTFFVFLVCLSALSMTKMMGNGVIPKVNEYFLNAYEERVIVVKQDKSSITPEEIAVLENLSYIENVVKCDQLLDSRVAIISNEQYSSLFAMAAKQLSASDITYGVSPVDDDEVVISGSYNKEQADELLNKRIQVTSDYEYIRNCTIVGIVNSNEIAQLISGYIYFTDQYFDDYSEYLSLKKFSQQFKIRFLYRDEFYFSDFNFGYGIEVNESLSGNDIILNVNKLKELVYDSEEINVDLMFMGEVINHTKIDDPVFPAIQVSKEFYDNNVDKNIYQISLNINNSRELNRCLTELNSLGYYATSPFNNSIDIGSVIGVLLSILSGFSGLINLLVIYLVSYLVIKTILLNKKKDYTILRTIGIDKKSIMNINKAEMFICFTVAYIIVTILFIDLKYANIPYLGVILSIFNVFDIFIIYLVNVIVSLVISHNFNKLLMRKSLLSNLKME